MVGHLALPLLPVTIVVAGLMMLQPDLGTTLIISGTMFLLMFAAGVRLRYLLATGSSAERLGWR